jgi:hypothetical protein
MVSELSNRFSTPATTAGSGLIANRIAGLGFSSAGDIPQAIKTSAETIISLDTI